ncbi:hypothetical protein AVEN_124237-1 [Araneus ventricosus]|uniref:Uncharacterized protein n=1 Tax=Araneus ventricosus TaxID=182803 RepID=A0A4Y2LXK9_ARAVE|nr:hypothetical protein AVEN_124237-1 [Araneus ventricosus]
MKKKEWMKLFYDMVSIDDNLQTSCEKCDSEIATDIINSKVISNQEVQESVSEDEEIPVPNLPSSIDVRKALDVLRCTLERRGGNIESYKNFYKLSNDVESLISNSANQTTIRQYFKTLL